MLIRALVPGDRPVIAEMLGHCGAFSPEEIRVALEVFDEGAASAGPDGYALFGADQRGHLQGYVCVGHVPLTASTWDLYWICVHPEAQRRGVARALMAHAEAHAAAHGGGRIVAQVSGRPNNAAVRRFYQAMGYELVGRIHDYFKDGDDGVFYRRVIGPPDPSR